MIRYNPISDTPISYIAHEKKMQLVSELRHVSYLTCLLERDFGILGFWKIIFIKIDI